MYVTSSRLNFLMAFWSSVVKRVEILVPKSLYMPCVQYAGRQTPWRMNTGVVETFRLTTA